VFFLASKNVVRSSVIYGFGMVPKTLLLDLRIDRESAEVLTWRSSNHIPAFQLNPLRNKKIKKGDTFSHLVSNDSDCPTLAEIPLRTYEGGIFRVGGDIKAGWACVDQLLAL